MIIILIFFNNLCIIQTTNSRAIIKYPLRRAEPAVGVFLYDTSMLISTALHDSHVHVLVSANNIEHDHDFNSDARNPFVHSNNYGTQYRSMLLQKAQYLILTLSIKLATSKSEGIDWLKTVNILEMWFNYFW